MLTWYDILQPETRDDGYGARHRSSPLRMQTRLPATQRTKAARRGGVFLVVSFLAPLATLAWMLSAGDSGDSGDSGEGNLGRAERQEHLWTGDTDLSSWSSVDPADPASLPSSAVAGSSETPPEADGGTTPVGPIPTPTAATVWGGPPSAEGLPVAW
ncbi:hypothetical protein CA850_29030 [Micromonospora echinospora]|nr:hypothetical protein CA850_29030 [Micromonospora echinospora]